MMDETHPFLVDDYRMEVQKEMERIDRFYTPLILREAQLLREKRKRGLVKVYCYIYEQIHIEPEPFYLEGLDEIIPKLHEYLEGDTIADTVELDNNKNEKKLLNQKCL